MITVWEKLILPTLVVYLQVKLCKSIDWRAFKCASDANAYASDGPVPLGRFPWLGVVQHSFYMAEKIRFAVTTGILIHPGYVLAPADDIGRIPIEQVANGTKFIVWDDSNEKFALEVYDYALHPDFTEKTTVATVALLQLKAWYGARGVPPVDPVCLPLKGSGTFDNLHVAKFNDDHNTIEKELLKVNYIPDNECNEFYKRSKLDIEMMSPRYPLCTSVAAHSESCIWDSGAILITRINFAFWTLLGFGFRGPGCGAPARFASIHRMLEWIDQAITSVPMEDVPAGHNAFYLRQMTPKKLVLYNMGVGIDERFGQCHRKVRGPEIYSEDMEIRTNRNVGQGFFFVAVHTIAQFSCAIVKFEDVFARSRPTIWVEHHCHEEVAALAVGMQGPEPRKRECFMYFKSTAFVEFRFTFSFIAVLTVQLFAVSPKDIVLPNPWHERETTEAWWPTYTQLRPENFQPFYFWPWYM